MMKRVNYNNVRLKKMMLMSSVNITSEYRFLYFLIFIFKLTKTDLRNETNWNCMALTQSLNWI